MTNRMDHTDCPHDATPKGRAWCRKDRLDRIAKLQREYMVMSDSGDVALIREYEAGVDLFAMRYGMDLHDAYDLIERGPVIH